MVASTRAHEGAPRQVIDELQQAKVLRAVYSERQLDEVLVDFWMNHFNVYANKGPEKFLVGAYERDVIRPNAPGGASRTCCVATATSPAMLFYLDNWLSADPNAATRPGRGAGGTPRRARGLNENYARELMELHTLGVDGGYTQKDVTEVARGAHRLVDRRPARRRPAVRLQRAGARSRRQGRARPRHQGRRAARKESRCCACSPAIRAPRASSPRSSRGGSWPTILRRALVERAAATFERTGGDIRAVVTTIVTSPEFFAPEARAAKIKTPLEFVASAVRASGAKVTQRPRARPPRRPHGHAAVPAAAADRLQGHRRRLGLDERLLARMNFASDLAAGKVPGSHADARSPILADAGRALGAPAFQRR